MECGISSSVGVVDDGQVVLPGGGDGNLMPKTGMVNQVCREWLVHEDSALAYKLQEKEIEMHYGKNRDNRKLVRNDLERAKNLQLEEHTEATSYKRSVMSIEFEDEQLARKLQEELEEEATAKIKSLELADKKIAKELQQMESQHGNEVVFNKKLHKPHKTKVSAAAAAAAAAASSSSSSSSSVSSHHRHHKKANSRPFINEASSFMMDGSPGECSPATAEDKDCYSSRKESSHLALSAACSLDRPVNYLTMPPTLSSPTAAVTEEEMRLIQEEEDERLARLLQEQESLQKSSQSYRDQQLAIEVQDRELARLLQEQERARARKARQKSHKARAAGEQTQLGVKGEGKRSTSSSLSHIQQRTSEVVVHSDSSEACSSSGSHSSSGEMHRKPVRPTNLSVSSSYSQDSRLELPPRHRELLSNRESPHSTTFNVATAIDPTYRRSHSNDRLVHELPSASPILPTPVSIRSGSFEGGAYPEEEEEDDNEYDQLDEDRAPPYMPIQGQKRIPSEKQRKKKESCKQQ